MILRARSEVGIAFLVPGYESVVLGWEWSIIVCMAIGIGRVGSKAFAAFAVFVMLEAVSDAAHIQADIEYSARHDGQMFDSERTDPINY